MNITKKRKKENGRNPYEFAKAEVLEAGREEGRKEGRAEGLALKLQAEKEIAQSLAARGMALSDIAEITKVSLETIRKWLEKK